MKGRSYTSAEDVPDAHVRGHAPVWMRHSLPDTRAMNVPVPATVEAPERLLTAVRAAYGHLSTHANFRAVSTATDALSLLQDVQGCSMAAYALLLRGHAHIGDQAHTAAITDAMEAWAWASAPLHVDEAAVVAHAFAHDSEATVTRPWLAAHALFLVAEVAYAHADYLGAALCVCECARTLHGVLHTLRSGSSSNEEDAGSEDTSMRVRELTLMCIAADSNAAACFMCGGAFAEAHAAYVRAEDAARACVGVASPLYDAVRAAHEKLRALAVGSAGAEEITYADPARIHRADTYALATDANYVVQLPPSPDTGAKAAVRRR